VWVTVRVWVRVRARSWSQTKFSVRLELGVGFELGLLQGKINAT
jgi:hypothetical protein